MNIYFKLSIALFYYSTLLSAEKNLVNNLTLDDIPKDIFKYKLVKLLEFKDIKNLWFVNKRCNNILKPILVSTVYEKERDSLESFEIQQKIFNSIEEISNKALNDYSNSFIMMVKNCTLPDTINKVASFNFFEYDRKLLHVSIILFNRINLLKTLLLANSIYRNDILSLSRNAISLQNIKMLKFIDDIHPDEEIIYSDILIYTAYNKLNSVKFLYEKYGITSLKTHSFLERTTIVHESCTYFEASGSKEVILCIAKLEPSLFESKDGKGDTPIDILHHLLSKYIQEKNLILQKELTRFLFELTAILKKSGSTVI